MASQPHTISLPERIYSALEEAAAREHKSVEEMAGETIMRGLSSKENRKAQLEELRAYGKQKAIETFGHVPSEEEIAGFIRANRQHHER